MHMMQQTHRFRRMPHVVICIIKIYVYILSFNWININFANCTNYHVPSIKVSVCVCMAAMLVVASNGHIHLILSSCTYPTVCARIIRFTFWIMRKICLSCTTIFVVVEFFILFLLNELLIIIATQCNGRMFSLKCWKLFLFFFSFHFIGDSTTRICKLRVLFEKVNTSVRWIGCSLLMQNRIVHSS